MSKTDYARALRDALYDPNPNSSARRVKDLVIRELLEVDPRVEIKNTEYFNHTFSPDLVLSWPEGPAVKKRYLFLRLPDTPKYFAEDVELISELHPIVYGLDDGPNLATSMTAVAELSHRNDVLVTDVHGMNRLARNREDRSIANLVSSALIRGGRGLMDSNGAEQISASVNRGFEGARSADAGPTETAVDSLQHHLMPVQSRQMTQFLQAVWISSHGRIEGFPGPTELSGEISDESLEYLIHFDAIDDTEFWRALGSSLSVEQLSRLKVIGEPANFQHLVGANLDRLWSRHLRVKVGELALTSSNIPLWTVTRNSLCLQGVDYSAYFAENSPALKHIKPDRANGISVHDVRRRSINAHLSEITIKKGAETFTVEAEGNGSVLEAESLSALPESYLGDARAVRATCKTLSNQEIRLDFMSLDASAVTSARITLHDWVTVALPLLWEVSDEDHAAEPQGFE
ncbi:hypothetical protein ACFWVB_22875 [Streptomyces microflavus]|uniref:hypothetical protein n=1 Tax=Streptomyces microflavus TaxID=1919 RepID=UPI003654C03F